MNGLSAEVSHIKFKDAASSPSAMLVVDGELN